MPRKIVKNDSSSSSPLVGLLEALIALTEEDYRKISEASLAGRKLRFELEAIKAAL